MRMAGGELIPLADARFEVFELRSGERARDRLAHFVPHRPGLVVVHPARFRVGEDQDTIADAPNSTKQPRMTVTPWRQLIRPVSIMNPTVATAITAATVANVPSSVPCSQAMADTRAPDPAGSE